MPAVFKETGQVRAGYRADLVILSADPRVDVANLAAIDMVFLGGEPLDRRSLMARHVPDPDGLLLESDPMPWPPELLVPGSRSPKPEYSWLDSVEAFDITYLSDGLRVAGYMVEPKGEGPFPCLIVNRGGNREFAALTPRTVALLMARMASWGYLVVGSQYRGNAGGEGREEFGGADVNDVLNLVPLLEARPKADTKRLGMYGASRGGMMTYLALARSDRFKAAVLRSGVSDLLSTRKDRPEMDSLFVELIPGYDFRNEQPLIDRSAVRWADKLPKTTPILILQGTADWRVDPRESLEMSRALLDANRPFRLVLLEGGDHGLGEHRPEMYHQVRSWLDRYVRDGESLPNLVPHGD
ncbi:MAG: peptidase [bacterium]|nr:MAG: peptidase [bacterium]